MGSIFFGCVIGFIGWFLVRYLAAGFYTVNQNERAVKPSFGRAERVGVATTAQDPDISRALFNVLETQNIIAGEANITLIPKNANLLGELVAATQTPKAAAVK